MIESKNKEFDIAEFEELIDYSFKNHVAIDSKSTESNRKTAKIIYLLGFLLGLDYTRNFNIYTATNVQSLIDSYGKDITDGFLVKVEKKNQKH